ncbi:hypothetical protein AOA60_21670, partial [Pseudomonas sp. 2822-17]
MTLKNLMEQYGDSPEVAQELNKIAEQINEVSTNSKAEKALSIIQESDDKVIIFTEYHATQLYLQWFLAQHGIKA